MIFFDKKYLLYLTNSLIYIYIYNLDLIILDRRYSLRFESTVLIIINNLLLTKS